MHRWKFSVLATAAILSAGLYTTDASALALGRVNVQSALGEPLRAEVELPQITAAEAESLRVSTATPEVFRSQGMEYSPAAHSVQVQLHRRTNGSMVLRLSSTRPVNDPFVDLVIDATWSSGHIVRSYTMLFDPPASRPQAAVTAAPQVTSPRAAATAPRTPATTAAPAPVARPATPPAPAVAGRPTPADAPASAGGVEIRVRPGDTAGRIAEAHRPAGVSLDQMLVAMMRANPDAFVNSNVNRLRSGAVLQMPSETEAQATDATEARKIVAAQSRDFNEFRRRMAATAPKAEVAAAERSARGTVQTQVDESKPAAAGPDKLTLSKGSVQAQKTEEQMARDKQAEQNSARMAELSKNISDLNQLSGASAPAGAGAAAPGATAPSAPASQPAVAVPAAGGLPAPATAAASADMSTATAEAAAPAPEASAAEAAVPAEAASQASAAAPAPAAVAPRPAPQPVPYEEPSFLDALTEDPLLAGGALALVLALLGYGGYRVVQSRRNQGALDSSFSESSLQPDSFFGASGGQRVDTANSELTTGSSSMTYSPSQLDAGGDVDPVAEADVYLAYGRDLQAEEILKEALRHHPERVSIPAKLAEIYAKRQDRKALESVANDVFRLTNGQGPDWTRVSDLGRTLDPENPLYQPGGRPAVAASATAAAASTAAFASTLGAATAPAAPTGGPDSVLPDLDLDLDLDLHEAPSAPAPAPSTFAMAAANNTAAAAPVVPAAQAPVPSLDLGDLELPQASWDEPAVTPQTTTEPDVQSEPLPLNLDDDLSLMDSGVAPLTSRDAKAVTSESLEFDLGDLSLDLDTPTAAAPVAPSVAAKAASSAADALPDDPLATKLALAEEFNTIGDSEGARALVEEVIAESSGELKARAQRLLAELG